MDSNDFSTNQQVPENYSITEESDILSSQSGTTVSTDLEKSSYHSLAEADKSRIASQYPNQIISNQQFNKQFNVPANSKNINSSLYDNKLDFDLSQPDQDEAEVKQANFEQRKFLKKKFLSQLNDLRSKSKTRHKYFDINDHLNESNSPSNSPEQKIESSKQQNIEIIESKVSPNPTYQKNQISDITDILNNIDFGALSDNEFNISINKDLTSSPITNRENFNNQLSPIHRPDKKGKNLTVENKQTSHLISPDKRREIVKKSESSLSPKSPIENQSKNTDRLDNPLHNIFESPASLNNSKDSPLISPNKQREIEKLIESSNSGSPKSNLTSPDKNEISSPNKILKNSKNDSINKLQSSEKSSETLSPIIRRSLKEGNLDMMREKTSHLLSNLVKKFFIEPNTSIKNSFDDYELNEKAKLLATFIKNGLKELHENQMKIIVTVTIGNLNNDSAKFAYKCYWDKKTDLDNCFLFNNNFIYCVVTTLAVAY